MQWFADPAFVEAQAGDTTLGGPEGNTPKSRGEAEDEDEAEAVCIYWLCRDLICSAVAYSRERWRQLCAIGVKQCHEAGRAADLRRLTQPAWGWELQQSRETSNTISLSLPFFGQRMILRTRYKLETMFLVLLHQPSS